MEQYLPIVLLLALGAAFAAGSFAASRLLGPSRPTGAKEGPYESGIASEGGESARFPVRFFMVAMIFIIFDIEVVFLYPWAVDYHQLNLFGLGEMAAFALVVFVSFAYLVSNGALDWGPRRRSARQDSAVTRTMSSTVRRVPRPSELGQGTDTIARYDQGGSTASTGPSTGQQPTPEPGPTTPEPGESEPVPAGH